MNEFYHIFDTLPLIDLQVVGNLAIFGLAATFLFTVRMAGQIMRRRK